MHLVFLLEDACVLHPWAFLFYNAALYRSPNKSLEGPYEMHFIYEDWFQEQTRIIAEYFYLYLCLCD